MASPARLVLLFLFVSVLSIGLAAAGDEPPWPGLEPGSHAVGYRVEHVVDDTRPFGPDPASGRPIQISIWYPTPDTDRGAVVTWRDYFHSAATETDFSEPDDERRVRHLEDVREAALSAGADAARFDRMLDEPTTARMDVRTADGLFPLVIFVPGFGAPAFQNTAACEYLASRGFVVASFPSMGRDSREMTHDEKGVDAQVRDIEVVIEKVSELMPVDARHVGLVGYSWGGLTTTFAAMRGMKIDALVMLDPTLAVRAGHELARNMNGYDPASIEMPVMVMIAAAKEWKERDITFFDELSGTDVLLLRFNDFKHGDFGSVILRFFVHTLPDGGGRDVERLDEGYAAECVYLAAFFDAHLRGGAAGKAFLSQASNSDRVSVEKR